MSIRVLALVACLFLAGSQAQSVADYALVSCATNRTDAFCSVQATSVSTSGVQCCAVLNSTTRSATTGAVTNATVGTFCLPTDISRSASSYSANVNLTYNWACVQSTSVAPTTCSANKDCTTAGTCCSARGVSIAGGSVAALYNACSANTTLAYSANITSAAGNQIIYARTCLEDKVDGNGSGNNTNSTDSNAMIIKYSVAMISALFALAFF